MIDTKELIQVARRIGGGRDIVEIALYNDIELVIAAADEIGALRAEVAHWQTAYEDKCREVIKLSDIAVDYLIEREEARRWARKFYRELRTHTTAARCDTPGCTNAAIEISVGEGYCEGARFRCAKHKEAE